MDKVLVIDARGSERRAALLTGSDLIELLIERVDEGGISGNVYLGRVSRVIPGMQAAFVDLGIEKAAFLHVADIPTAGHRRSTNGEHTADEPSPPAQPIENVLIAGQEIVVQVAKEPLGTKGPRVTGHISLPGRHLVYTPTTDHIGVSRRITSEAERERLRGLVESLRHEGAGYIVRTAAEGQPAEELEADMRFLERLWQETLGNRKRARAPSILYRDLDLVLRAARDLLTADIARCLVNDPGEHERLQTFVTTYMPDYLQRLELYEDDEPIFDRFGAEPEIDRALESKVWLKSGGYLVIDETEALTAIDVNTGRFVGHRNLEDTITRLNLEATREIANQLRIRNLGGIIIIDFIDMEEEANREKVLRALHEAVSTDRARSSIGPISDLCLVEMTRKRTRESLRSLLTESCFYCDGKGYIKTAATVSQEILRLIARTARSRPADIRVTCHPGVAEQLAEQGHEEVLRLEELLDRSIHVRVDSALHVEHFEVEDAPASEVGDDAPKP